MSGPLSDGLRLARREPVYSLVIVMVLSTLRLLGVRPRVRGLEHLPTEGGFVVAASHFSYVDFALVGWVLWDARRRPMRYLATAAAFRHPVTGPLMRGARHVPVDRKAGASAYTEGARVLQTGEVIGIFPESQVSLPYELLAFKTGAVRLAAAAQVPLLPVTVWGSQRILTKGRRARWREAWRAPVTIEIGPPLHPAPEVDAREASEQLRAVMADQLHRQQEDFPLGTPAGAWWLPARLGGGAPRPEVTARG